MSINCSKCPEHPEKNCRVIDTHSIHEHTMPGNTFHEYEDLVNSSLETGTHHDQGKPSLALLSRISLEDTARVMDFGAAKYSTHNWHKGISWTAIMSSALRHLYAFNDGEDLDEESGLSHLAHAMCDVMFLLEYYHLDMSEFDDRWKVKATKTD